MTSTLNKIAFSLLILQALLDARLAMLDSLVGHMDEKESSVWENPLSLEHCDLMLTALGVSSSLAKYMALA